MLKFLRPARAEAVLPEMPMVARHERVYAIGDVHGRFDLLIALLRKIAADAADHNDNRAFRLVFLGDYVDRGDDSRKVLDLLCALSDDKSRQINFLLGNHEAALLGFLDDPMTNANWLEFGGAQTLASYGVPAPKSVLRETDLLATADALRAAMGPHIALIEKMELMVRSGDMVFSHAGLRPDRPTDAQATNDLIWGHPGFLCNLPVPGLKVVHGHWDHSDPISLPGRICVDTGAYYSGRLTAVRLDDDEAFISVYAADLHR